MKRRKSQTVVICAVLVALTFILGWIPYGGPFLLPTLIAAVCFGLGIGVFSSVAFGVIGLLMSYMVGGVSTVGVYFLTYPWLPIVARAPVGVIAYFVFKLVKKLIPSNKTAAKVVPIAAAAFAGSLANTFFVGLFIILLKTPELPAKLEDITIGFLMLMGSIEIIVNVLILPPLVFALKKASPRLFGELEPKKIHVEKIPEEIPEDNPPKGK